MNQAIQANKKLIYNFHVKVMKTFFKCPANFQKKNRIINHLN